MKFILSFLFLLFIGTLQAQDAYHVALQDEFINKYGLPAGQWILNNTEQANLDSDYWYGDLEGENIEASEQSFSQKVQLKVNVSGQNQWDVLNEITTNRDLEGALRGTPGYITGREIYRDIFEKVEALDPNVGTYINDYVTISQSNTEGELYDGKKQFIREIIESGTPIDGIGFQAHIGGYPTAIPVVYDV